MALLTGAPRRLAQRLHRWLGLGLGAVFVLLGLTGSFLVFYTEIDAAIEPALALRGPEPVVTSWQAVLDTLQRTHPQRDRGWRIELPPEGRGLVTARYLKPSETAGAFFAPLLVTVHPETGQVLASRWWGRFAATWVYDLHYTLLAGEAGRTVVGVLGLLLLGSLLAGLLLWWPRTGHRRGALRLKLNGSRQRRHYDLHKLAGVGGGALLLVLAITGAALALPEWVEPAVARLSPPLALPKPQAQRLPDQPVITLDQALARAQAHWPEGRARWVDTPAAAGAFYRVRLWLPGSPSQRFARNFVWIDAQTGQVLAAHDSRRQGTGDAVLAWLHPLHNGAAFGLTGRVLACLGGLLLPLLMLTGLQRWLDRRRAARLASPSVAQQSALAQTTAASQRVEVTR